jgi:arylformamidase
MIIDISPLLDANIGLWPGDPRNTLHIGVHVDAPHGIGDDITSWPLDTFVGRCNVIHVDVDRGERITSRHIEGKTIDAPRVLFRTNTFPDWRNWNHDFASLSIELLDALPGVVLVGIDTPSVDPFDSKALEVHHALAAKRIASLEGVVLGGVGEGSYELIALPLRLKDGDASPVRAVLRTLA